MFDLCDVFQEHNHGVKQELPGWTLHKCIKLTHNEIVMSVHFSVHVSSPKVLNGY
jgi:hypothetical protein